MRHITYDFGFNLKEIALLFQAHFTSECYIWFWIISYVICLILETLVGFYFETPHQNVLILLGWPYGVVNYNPEVKWAWNNRAFSFKSNPKSFVICLRLECLVGFDFESKYHNGRTLPLIVFAFIDCLFVCTRQMLLY